MRYRYMLFLSFLTACFVSCASQDDQTRYKGITALVKKVRGEDDEKKKQKKNIRLPLLMIDI